jgi:hypothetical protein
MRMLNRLTLALGVLVAACGDDGLSPADLAGSYVATVFAVTPAGQSAVDVLAAGGSLTITLSASGSTTGSLVVPASVPGGPLTASMAGTFSLNGTTVTFTQAADTFVRNMPMTASGSTLTATQSFGGDTVQLTLTRQ